jgi:general L-amino acid transport system substrate-binding protein
MVSTRAFAGPTLDKIKASGSLNCGVDTEAPEYTIKDAHGNHTAFDADLCKAIAVATLGPEAKFKIVLFRDEEDAVKALKSGEIAVLATGSINIRTTGADSGLGFSRPVLYDYQGFLVNKTMGIHSAKDLAGKKTCFIVGSEIEYQAGAYMAREGIKWIPGPFSEEGEMEAALLTNNCAAVTADVTQLAYERIAFRGLAKNFDILPEMVAKDPLGVTYRLDDPQWAAIVNWTVEALIQAEESGITQANLQQMKSSNDIVIQRLLGTNKGWCYFLGLDDAWAERTISAVGNYGEIFDRDLGAQSPMKLDRGINSLWTHGGLMYALPMR